MRPFSNLYLDTEVHWDHYDKSIPFADVALALSIPRSGGRTDYIGSGLPVCQSRGKGVNGSAHVNLDYGFAVGEELSRSISADNSLAMSLYVDYQSQCWGVRVITDNLDGIGSIMVQFRLLGLGDMRGK